MRVRARVRVGFRVGGVRVRNVRTRIALILAFPACLMKSRRELLSGFGLGVRG